MNRAQKIKLAECECVKKALERYDPYEVALIQVGRANDGLVPLYFQYSRNGAIKVIHVTDDGSRCSGPGFAYPETAPEVRDLVVPFPLPKESFPFRNCNIVYRPRVEAEEVPVIEASQIAASAPIHTPANTSCDLDRDAGNTTITHHTLEMLDSMFRGGQAETDQLIEQLTHIDARLVRADESARRIALNAVDVFIAELIEANKGKQIEQESVTTEEICSEEKEISKEERVDEAPVSDLEDKIGKFVKSKCPPNTILYGIAETKYGTIHLAQSPKGIIYGVYAYGLVERFGSFWGRCYFRPNMPYQPARVYGTIPKEVFSKSA